VGYEFHLLKLLLIHEELAAAAALHLNPDWIQHSLTRQIVFRRLIAQREGTWLGLAGFLDEFESATARSLITEAATEERELPKTDTQIGDVILKLRNQYLDRQLETLTMKMSRPEIPDEEKISRMREHQKLREQKRAPLTPV
jgi:hypothetical protein